MGLEKLKYILKVRGLKVNDLSEITGISESTLNKIIGGHNPNPGYKTIVKIAHALSLTIDELVDLLDLDYMYKGDHKNLLTRFNLLPEHSQEMISMLIDFELDYRNEIMHGTPETIPEPYEPELIAAHGTEGMDDDELELVRQDVERLKKNRK